MHYVYLLKSEVKNKHYVGIAKNVKKRLLEHNAGKVRSTKPYIPYRCLYLEGYASVEDAKIREKRLKNFGKAYVQLKKRLKYSLQAWD
ncbi:MAG: GIY-YIG nuclease family protein [bacterium]|nr:GIY-YIG nuclease family protein [bacterium]